MKKNKKPIAEITYRSKQLEVIKKKIIAIFEQKKNEALLATGKPLTIYSLYYKILPERYKEFGDLGISYSTFRNTLTERAEDTVDMYTVLALCHLWNLDVSYIFTSPDVEEVEMPPVEEMITSANGKFIVLDDPSYMGKFFGYMYSSNTNKDRDRIEFELIFEKIGTKTTAKMIYHGLPDDVRIFYGTPILAAKSNTVFILLTKPDGNFYILSFNYKKYNLRRMYYRKGAVLTASSVTDMPLIQSFILFEKPLSQKKKEYISGLLTVNDSIFYVSKNEIENLVAKDKLVSEFFETFSFIIEPDQETVYQISEKQIFETLEKRQYKHLNKNDIIHSLIKLKEHSLSPDKVLYDDLGEFAQFAKHLQGISSSFDDNNE